MQKGARSRQVYTYYQCLVSCCKTFQRGNPLFLELILSLIRYQLSLTIHQLLENKIIQTDIKTVIRTSSLSFCKSWLKYWWDERIYDLEMTPRQLRSRKIAMCYGRENILEFSLCFYIYSILFYILIVLSRLRGPNHSNKTGLISFAR